MTYQSYIPRITLTPAYVAVTLRLADAHDDLLVRHVRLLRDCVALAQQRWDFTIEAAVVLPDEMQMLCGVSDADFGVRGAINLIMVAFQRHVPGGEQMIWSDNNEITEIAGPAMGLRKTFIEASPVRAGLVQNPKDWPYSSAHVQTAQSTSIGVAVA